MKEDSLPLVTIGIVVKNNEATIAEALQTGMATVSDLHERGLQFETLIAVKGRFRMTDGLRACISPL